MEDDPPLMDVITPYLVHSVSLAYLLVISPLHFCLLHPPLMMVSPWLVPILGWLIALACELPTIVHWLVPHLHP